MYYCVHVCLVCRSFFDCVCVCVCDSEVAWVCVRVSETCAFGSVIESVVVSRAFREARVESRAAFVP